MPSARTTRRPESVLQRWISGILAALAVAGITALVVLYGDVGSQHENLLNLRRDVDRLDARAGVYGEAVARLEERIKGCRAK